jgi:hypothetical protein
MTSKSFLVASLCAASFVVACVTDGETPNCPAGDQAIKLYDIHDVDASNDPAVIAQRAQLVREGCATAAGTATGGLITNPPPGGAGGVASGGASGQAGGGGSGG